MRDPKCDHGYVQLQVDDPEKHVPMNSNIYGLVPEYMRLLKEDTNDKFFFMPTKFKRWIISVFDKAMPKIRSQLSRFGIRDVSFHCFHRVIVIFD